MLDIRKGLNALPRMPIWYALLQMNFPQPILHAWGSFVNGQCRRYRVRSSVSDSLRSTVGMPEGCGMSVFAMTLVDYLLDLWISHQCPSARVWTFVDDWQIVVQSVPLLEQAWQAVGVFAQMLDLSIDEGKTFAWSAQTAERQVLRRGRLKLQLSAMSPQRQPHSSTENPFHARHVEALTEEPSIIRSQAPNPGSDGMAQSVAWRFRHSSWPTALCHASSSCH